MPSLPSRERHTSALLKVSWPTPLRGEAALMGLLSLTAVLSGGYGFGAGGLFFSLNLGSVY